MCWPVTLYELDSPKAFPEARETRLLEYAWEHALQVALHAATLTFVESMDR